MDRARTEEEGEICYSNTTLHSGQVSAATEGMCGMGWEAVVPLQGTRRGQEQEADQEWPGTGGGCVSRGPVGPQKHSCQVHKNVVRGLALKESECHTRENCRVIQRERERERERKGGREGGRDGGEGERECMLVYREDAQIRIAFRLTRK